MPALAQLVRDRLQYSHGYLQGRLSAVPSSLTQLYALVVSRLTSFLTLPLPLLSFLALPLYGGSSTTVNLVFFYLTWSALVLSHSPLALELYGTLAIRLLCFVLPALLFLAFDCSLPKISKGFKAHGSKHLPARHSRNRILRVAAVAIGNVLLSVLVQGVLEQASTRLFHMRSLLRVTTAVPLPWTMVRDVLRGLVMRSVLHYLVHRYLLHTHRTVFRTWHLEWQHSVVLPFSLVAAYDHPVNFLLSEWLPAFLPAYLFRWHVLTWHLFLAIVSLEELFVFSGYGVLPSAILIAGMARRNDAHFMSVARGRHVGNFGYLGLIDLVLSSKCKEEVDVLDDLVSEANKHRLQERIENVVDAAMSDVSQKRQDSSRNAYQTDEPHNAGESGSDNQDEAGGADKTAPVRRRGLRQRVRKG